MRKSIERLAWELERDRDEIDTLTLGEVADEYGQSIERIMDALDVIKIVRGDYTQIPSVDWNALV